MRATTPAAALQKLRALAAGFRLHALEELRDASERLTGEPAEQQAMRDALPTLLHRLAGSGPTFGFNELGRRARRLQRRLQQDDPKNAAIARELAAMRLALERAELPDRAP